MVSAMRSALLADEHDPVPGTGHRAADVDQVALRVDLLHAEMRLRAAFGSEVAGHLLALDHARRIGAGPDRAGTPVLRVAVCIGPAMEVPALHHALETAALARARDFHG